MKPILPSRTGKRKILIIDDDENIYRLLALMMRDQHYEVIWAPDGSQGFEMAVLNDPALIILDIFMPTLNGLELLRWFRRSDAARKTPILMLTADRQEGSETDAFLFRADAFVTKPFDISRLYQEIERLLARMPGNPG